MERFPVTPGYRRELTWRFRFSFFLIILLATGREFLRWSLQLEFHRMPLEVIWHPPARDGAPDAVALVEFLNYTYVFLFVLWIRDGCVLSLDFICLRIRDVLSKARRSQQAWLRL